MSHVSPERSGSSPELLMVDAETAARITAHFSIQVYGVEHGHTADQMATLLPGADPSHIRATVTDEQRFVTRTLADNLGPGDVLFREAYGYVSQTAAPSQDSQAKTYSAEERSRAKDMLAAAQHEYDAISYGATHAIINGAHVMYADCNAEQKAAHEAAGMTLGSNLDKLEEDREIAALATMLTYAVSQLPPEGTAVPRPQDRRCLMLFFGGSHTARMRNLATAANAPLTVSTTDETRKVVILQAAVARLAGSAAGLIRMFMKE